MVEPLLDRLVRDKVRARFGGRLKAMVSGGAPLNPEIGSFFLALGVQLLQGYGQTEAAPVIACNPPGAIRIDSVGPPLDGVEVRIAEDGEILVAGDNVMKGYWNDPEATARTSPMAGWRPAISAISTPTAICASPTASATSSRIPAAT